MALTIPAAYVHEMGLAPGDHAIVKREPDGLRLRIVRHSKMVELANAPDETVSDDTVSDETDSDETVPEQAATVAAE